MSTPRVLTMSINWPVIFSQDSFRLGWRHKRQGTAHDYSFDINKDHMYTLGRLMATEAKHCGLPDIAPYLSVQMMVVVQQVPEAIKDMCASTLRETIDSVLLDAQAKGEDPKTFQLHIHTGIGVNVQTAVFQKDSGDDKNAA